MPVRKRREGRIVYILIFMLIGMLLYYSGYNQGFYKGILEEAEFSNKRFSADGMYIKQLENVIRSDKSLVR